jgi:hypothetical protein
MNLQPLDIVLVDGLWYNPAHWMIQWRSLDSGVHCFTIKDTDGNGYNPLFKGVQIDNISKYKGRKITVCRYRYSVDTEKVLKWCEDKLSKSKRYDFFKQWLFGFVLGIATKHISNDPNAWTCSELPYWMFQDNGYKITTTEEVLPLPRLFRYHNDFEIVFSGEYN